MFFACTWADPLVHRSIAESHSAIGGGNAQPASEELATDRWCATRTHEFLRQIIDLLGAIGRETAIATDNESYQGSLGLLPS
jgi:hypothetical protein